LNWKIKTPAVFVADEARDERADRQSEVAQRNKLRVLRQRREAALDRGAKHVGADIEIVTVEEHPGAEQPENLVVEWQQRQSIKTRADAGLAHGHPPDDAFSRRCGYLLKRKGYGPNQIKMTPI